MNPTLNEGKLTQQTRANHTTFLDFFLDDAKTLWGDGIGNLFG